MKNHVWFLFIAGVMVCSLLACGSVFAQEETETLLLEASLDSGFNDQGWETRMFLGDPRGRYYTIDANRLSMSFPQKGDITMIMTNPTITEPDVKVEAEFQNISFVTASYAVICRYSEEGWYELRANIGGVNTGTYILSKYDSYQKSIGYNPYSHLHVYDKVSTNDLKLGMGARNKLGLVCKGDTFRIFINDVEQYPDGKGQILADSTYDSGTVGFVGFAYNEYKTAFDLIDYKVYGYGVQEDTAETSAVDTTDQTVEVPQDTTSDSESDAVAEEPAAVSFGDIFTPLTPSQKDGGTVDDGGNEFIPLN